MDIAGYLLGSGFALLIVLLGWADQITSKNKETKDLETDFLRNGKIKRVNYKKMVEGKGATQDSFDALIDFLYSAEKENVEIFELIVNTRKDMIVLDRQYRYRFWMLTCLSIYLFLAGILALFVAETYKLWLLAPNALLVALIFVNLIKIYVLETRHNRNIHNIMEKL